MVRRRWLPLLLLLAVLAAAAGSAYLDRKRARLAAVGASPTFILSDLEGTTVDLTVELHGHAAVLLCFWATWCAPCIEDFPRLEALEQQYSARGLKVLTINAGEERTAVDAFVMKHRPKLSILLDPQGLVTKRFQHNDNGRIGLPYHQLLCFNGTYTYTEYAHTATLDHEVERCLPHSQR